MKVKFGAIFEKNVPLKGFIWALIIIACSLYSCQKEQTVILYDENFDFVKELAKKENKAFCIVLSRPDCPPCTGYIQHLGEQYRRLSSKVFFNIVDVSLPENRWYQQWICSGAMPTTCIFSSQGELKAIVSGTTESCIQCIKSSISDNTKCASYFYGKNHPAKNLTWELLNSLLSCKWNLDKDEDISAEIQPCLDEAPYPYAVYLKCLNEEKQGRHEAAVYWAKRFLTFDNAFYQTAYGDLYGQMKSIINPDYTADNDAVLSVNKEIRLDECKLNQPVRFSIQLTNTGKSPLSVRDIRLSCSCVKLLGEKKQMILPGESGKTDFVFTADMKGEIFREITFYSDAANSIETVAVFALVK